MNRAATELWSAALGAAGSVIRYGHWGRPVLVFPSERGRATDFENNGMVGAVADLIDAGRLKLYCVDSYDAASWSNQDIPLEERARRHGRYESWIVGDVVPWIYQDCGGQSEVVTLGCSLGAFHAANFALKRADLFPLAMCFSGNYDPASWNGWGERGNETYFNNPLDYVGQPGRRPPRLAARPAQPAAGLRAGPVGGHHRVAAEHEAVRRAARREGDNARTRPVGV